MSFPIPQNARGFNHQTGWKMDDIKYNPKQKRILEGKFQNISKLQQFFISIKYFLAFGNLTRCRVGEDIQLITYRRFYETCLRA